MSSDSQKTEQSASELSITTTGITVKGDLVKSMEKPAARLSATADSVLRLFYSLVSLPMDYLSKNLESFRAKYADKFDEIPVEQRQRPSERVAVTAIQQAALSGDDPEVQTLFAQLLASASDARVAAQVHPGFVSIIAELSANDALYIRAIASSTPIDSPIRLGDQAESMREISSSAEANLLRLGIFEMRDLPYNYADLMRLVGQTSYNAPHDWNEGARTMVKLINDVQKLKNELVTKLANQHNRQAVYISPFGQTFIRVVIGPLPSMESVSTQIEV